MISPEPLHLPLMRAQFSDSHRSFARLCFIIIYHRVVDLVVELFIDQDVFSRIRSQSTGWTCWGRLMVCSCNAVLHNLQLPTVRIGPVANLPSLLSLIGIAELIAIGTRL